MGNAGKELSEERGSQVQDRGQATETTSRAGACKNSAGREQWPEDSLLEEVVPRSSKMSLLVSETEN